MLKILAVSCRINQNDMELHPVKKSFIELPLFSSKIQAGFPSPADDYLEECLSLDDICVSNAASTFLGRVTGKSLIDIQIYPGDILVIDKSLKPQDKQLVVCAIDGEFNAKIFRKYNDRIELVSANPKFKPIVIHELNDFRIWGVICHVIQDVRNRSKDWGY
jgi:DNA polymerase V